MTKEEAKNMTIAKIEKLQKFMKEEQLNMSVHDMIDLRTGVIQKDIINIQDLEKYEIDEEAVVTPDEAEAI